MRAFPMREEGELSRRLADLVRRESCAEVARANGAPRPVSGSAKASGNAGARNRTAILADVCESLIGAVFLDAGYAAAKAVIVRGLRAADARAAAAAARSENRLAGMGASARPDDAGLSRDRPHRAASRAGIHGGGRGHGFRARGCQGQLQTRRRAGGGRRLF